MGRNLILLRGVSGSGKSTIAKIWEDANPTIRIISTDDFFMTTEGDYVFNANSLVENHKHCQTVVERDMESVDMAGLDDDIILVHNTFTKEWEMQAYFDLAKRYEYTVHTIIVENRHGSKNIHDGPEDTVKIQKDRFEVVI